MKFPDFPPLPSPSLWPGNLTSSADVTICPESSSNSGRHGNQTVFRPIPGSKVLYSNAIPQEVRKSGRPRNPFPRNDAMFQGCPEDAKLVFQAARNLGLHEDIIKRSIERVKSILAASNAGYLKENNASFED